MISLEQAKALVLERFNKPKTGTLGLVEGDVYAIKDEDTIETTYGWIFHCNSRLYFETRNHRYLAIGHGPVVVEKRDGRMHCLGARFGTHFNREILIKLYEIYRLPLPAWTRDLIANVYIFLENRKRGIRLSKQ